MHNRQLLIEALWTCSCRRASDRAIDAASRDASGDGDQCLSAEVARHLAQSLVELVTPDVMYNDIPWPDEEFVHVSIERLYH